MWVEALSRFNQHDPGDAFEISEENGEHFIKEGLVRPLSINEVLLKARQKRNAPIAEEAANRIRESIREVD